MSQTLECGCSSGTPGDACRERGEWHVEQYTDGKFWVETQTSAGWCRLKKAEAERDALKAQVLDIHDALHRECDGKADLPSEIRALRAQVEAARAGLEQVRCGSDCDDMNCASGRCQVARDTLRAMDEAKPK